MSQKPPLLKGQGIRLVGPAVGLVIGIVVAIVVQVSVTGEGPSIGLPVAVGIGLLIAAGTLLVGLLLGRKAFGHRLELALRPAGETKWQHVYVEAMPGHMRFHRYRWQLRIFIGDPADYVVYEIGPSSDRRPSKKQFLSVNPALRVIDVQTDRGPLELGLQAHQVDDVRARLEPVDGASISAQDR